MSVGIVLTVILVFILLMLSALFNGSETALTASSRARMHALDQEGDRRAKIVNQLLSAPEKMLGAILLGNTLVDVLASAIASGLAVELFGE
ncbi:MAG: CNNM domain-containing protein, partial [Hyphomicrobium sp.]